MNLILRHAKKLYYSNKLKNKCMHNNVKGTWSAFNNLLRKSTSSLPKYFIHDDKCVNDPQQIAKEFNNHFIN